MPSLVHEYIMCNSYFTFLGRLALIISGMLVSSDTVLGERKRAHIGAMEAQSNADHVIAPAWMPARYNPKFRYIATRGMGI